jgi:hypothetical protein
MQGYPGAQEVMLGHPIRTDSCRGRTLLSSSSTSAHSL